LTLEEGEVFRRKAILDARADSSGSDDEGESSTREDVSGEELRKEVRPPFASVLDVER
jgi:hypothetical protein